jgi:hypothetical protein
MAKRTILNFEVNHDVWPVVEIWAKDTNHREITRGGNSRQYQNGYGFWVAPKRVEVRQEGTKVELQAWVYFPLLNRMMALFLMPSEIEVKPGFLAGLPRMQARDNVNILLRRLGQKPI